MDKKPQLAFYVYLHIRKDDGVAFYVGKGKAKRAWVTSGRSAYWNRVVAKHGLSVEIVKSDLSEEAALELEKATILKIGRGFLCNLTDGGEGVSGWRPSEENRARMSKAQKGRKHSVSSRLKMGKDFKKPVYCSNGLMFDGVADAVAWAKDAGFSGARQSVLSRCAAGLRKSAYSLAWSYFGFPTYDALEISLQRKAKQAAAKIGKKAPNIRSVIRSDGKVFESVKSAADFLKKSGHEKASSAAICACCRGRKKSAYGYGWEYEKA